MTVQRLAFTRNGWVLLLDLGLAAISFPLALWLRLGDHTMVQGGRYIAVGALLSILIGLPTFLQFRQPRALWRYTALHDIMTMLQSAFVIVSLTFGALFFIVRLVDVPRSLPLLQFMILVALLVLPRLIYRAKEEGHFGLSTPIAPEGPRTHVLLIGTNSTAEHFLRETQRTNKLGYRVQGLITTDMARVGQRMHNTPIYGPPSILGKVIEKITQHDGRPELLVLTDPETTGEKMREWLDVAAAHDLRLARLPSTLEMPDPNALPVLKPIALDDLLGRPQAPLDHASMSRLVTGKRVLVTGAGGSIGGELARQLLHCAPAQLTLMDSSEYALYQIEQEMLAQNMPAVPVYCMLGDVRDRLRLEQIFSFQQPDLVFHAAAIKHVPIAERDCEEAILTNVFGTQHVAECCLQFGTRAMVMISTDKAVEPTNVMGATKRLAERYFLWLSQQRAMQQENSTMFLAVRFGNVLGSTGSVVPLFQKQLAAGGPLTVTHPEMRRYFMSVQEAVELVLQAAALGTQEPSATRGRIFVLDMGEPMKIDDLARRMIQLAGLNPGKDVQITYSGTRPGEKLDEALFYDNEDVKSTAHASIQLAEGLGVDVRDLAEGLVSLEEACLNRDREQAFALLQDLVPEYVPYGWQAAA